MKEEYAAALTEAAAKAADATGLPALEVRYTFVYECDFLHQGKLFARSGACYPGPRELLLGEYPRDSVLGHSGTKTISVRSLLADIAARPPNSSGLNDFGGFAVVVDGRETATADFDGVLPGSMGFCLQRCRVKPEELGPFTDWQAMRMHGGDAERTTQYFARKGEEEQTMARRSFHAGGETVSFDYLRWLVRERLLEGVRIAHVVLYAWKDYLNPFVDALLQQRYDLRNDPTGVLGGLTKKLALNVIYGFYGIENSNFPVTKVQTEKTLSRERDKVELTQICLLGATEKEGKAPELLYAASSKRPRAKITNANQWPAAILSSSRVVFFGLVLKLLRYLEPGMAEICYMGEWTAAEG
jgi:hypothetical protein